MKTAALSLAALAAYLALLRLVGGWAVNQRDTITVAVMGPLFLGGLFLAVCCILAIGRAVWRLRAAWRWALLSACGFAAGFAFSAAVEEPEERPAFECEKAAKRGPGTF